MTRKVAALMAVAAPAVLGVTVVSAVRGWDVALWAILTSLLLASLALQLSSRAVLSRRLFAVGRKLERQLRDGARGRAPMTGQGAAGAVKPASGANGGTGATPGTPVVPARATAASVLDPAPRAAEPGAVASTETSSTRPVHAPRVELRTRPNDPVETILQSGIFDLDLYSYQVSHRFPIAASAVDHYLKRGRRSGFMPHPLFIPSLLDSNWPKSELDPLLAYLSNPQAARSVVTHPLFNPAELDLAAVPENETPLAWFLRTAQSEKLLPARFPLRRDRTLSDARENIYESFVEFARVEADARLLGGSNEPPVPTPELLDKLREFESSGRRPLVSIILPTWNRGRQIRASIESVLRQRYREWELLIADDGSLDDTGLVVGAVASRDSRVKLLTLPHQGVSAARNAALDVAAGKYVAFLDSDKEWDQEFLQTMAAVLEMDEVDAAVAACAVSYGQKVVYRRTQPTRGSLAIGNSVDQTALVARRDLVQAVGGFDESLRRAVDYDLVLKLAERTTLHQVPYVGVRYSEDDVDPNRISEFESKSWNHDVAERHAWAKFREANGARRYADDLVTVIVDDVRSLQDAREWVEYLHAQQDGMRIEVILVPHSGHWALRAALGTLRHAEMDVRVVTRGSLTARPRHINAAMRSARGATCLILDGYHRFRRGCIRTMLEHLEGASAVHPLVIDSTLLIDNAGVIYPEYGQDPVPFLAGMPADVFQGVSPVEVAGAPLPLLARTPDLEAVEGATARLESLWMDVDLSQKLGRLHGHPVKVVADVVVQQRGALWTGRTSNVPDDVRTFGQLWPVPPSGSRAALETLGVQALFTGSSALSFPSDPSRWTDAVLAPRFRVCLDRERPLRFAIRTAAPADERAANWGDFHFAQSLADAFRRAGHAATVDYQANSGRSTSSFEDVVVHLRGLHDAPIPSDATSVLWVISHPDLVTAKEVERYDIAYGASLEWCERQAQQWRLHIRPLLQCTDPHRFNSRVEAQPDVADSIVMVGNSRRQFRPAAWHAANAGYPVKIWGTLWEGTVPEEVIMGQSLPNDRLAGYYRSARWTLNDHWPDMRDDGFISNRIFDVLGSGGRLVTDDVRGLERVFGDRIAVFRTPAELFALLDSNPDAIYPAEVLEELCAEVRQRHSFDSRVERIVADVREHRAVRSQRW